MISIKSPGEIAKMRKAGLITAGALVAAGEAIRPGMTTKELDTIVRKYITSHGAKPGFLGYGGFPGSLPDSWTVPRFPAESSPASWSGSMIFLPL